MTYFGKITIIKTIVLSKFVHLFIALPNPPQALIKSLENTFYKFLWNQGPDRIKRIHSGKSIKAGGLGMIDLNLFILSLKIPWLRRCFVSNQDIDTDWKAVLNFIVLDNMCLGSNF